MVEHIKKIDSSHFKVQQRQETRDKRQSQQQASESEEEKDRFAKKEDFTKVLSDESEGRKQKASLWNQRLPPQSSGKKPESALKEIEEFSVSTSTITFLRAAGILDQHGHPRWSFVGLYSLALIGFVVTTLFLLRMLL